MINDAGQLFQVSAALSLSLAFFLATYLASPRTVVPWLICLSPFQTIDNPYASSSVLITYVVGIAYIMRGRLQYLPMLGFFAVILAIYGISTGLQHRATYTQHGLYIFNYLSAILIFYIVYNFVRETKDIALIVRTLIIVNVLVAAYCIVQMTFDRVSIFGIEELSIQGIRKRTVDPRLTGPYAGVGITAEFLVIHTLLAAYFTIYTASALRRNLLYLLMAVNIGCLIATANRGGFLVLIGGAGLFLFMFRKQLGVKRTLGISIVGTFLLVVSSVVVINFTNLGAMYDRLEATEIEGGVPDSRVNTWTNIVPRIADKPIFGHGPRLRLQDDYQRRYPGHEAIPYSHNLYLFLLYTVGISGTLAYLWFFAWLIARIRRGAKATQPNAFVEGFVRLGTLLIIVFLVDQVKIEFLRFALVDYWHYIFTIFAIWLALADERRLQKSAS